MADRELIAVVLRSGTHGQGALSLADGLLKQFGSMRDLASAVPEEIANVSGIGPAKAAGLVAAFELARRIKRDPDGRSSAMRTPERLGELFAPRLAGLRRETVMVAVLDQRLRMRRVLTVSGGAADHALLPVRDVLNVVLRNDGLAFAVAHNHPSGDLTPSRHDIDATRRLAEAAPLVGLRFLDHLIVADGEWVSLRSQL